jgi:hypothetical protein
MVKHFTHFVAPFILFRIGFLHVGHKTVYLYFFVDNRLQVLHLKKYPIIKTPLNSDLSYRRQGLNDCTCLVLGPVLAILDVTHRNFQ